MKVCSGVVLAKADGDIQVLEVGVGVGVGVGVVRQGHQEGCV